jgi:hypothetical protein
MNLPNPHTAGARAPHDRRVGEGSGEAIRRRQAAALGLPLARGGVKLALDSTEPF